MHPSTIKHHATFERSLPIGFDGVFDWSWTQGHLGQGKITPMDFDGVVERKGNFIVFETKGGASLVSAWLQKRETHGAPCPNG